NRLKIDTEPNPKHREDLRRQMLSVFNEAEQRPATRIIVLQILRRKIMKSPITRIAAAAVIIIAVLVGLHFLSDSVSMTSTAYAEIVERLHNARTMIYTANATTEIEIAFKKPGHMRTTMPGGFVTVIDWTQGKGLSTLPTRKQYIEMEMSNLPNDPAQQQFNVIEKLRTLPDRADEELGTREIDGRVLQGFRVTEEDVINTVWIDPQTRDLVRVETEFINAPGMNVVMTDFQFDVELEDSLFSLTPPEGYTRVEVQADVSGVTEQDLIEYLRAWSSWTKDGTFPPTFNPMELQKVSMEMEQQGKFGDGQTTEQQRKRAAMTIYRGIMFLTQLPADSNWRYTGEDVKFGDANTAIFWYRPKGSENYRVIYGDLSVKDVEPENLPK
ncbi:MAG: outer membrane lipoprotein carrier protein LolA, partial [Phycisphaerae bacterium]